jgi:putative ABC transport system permease protein
MNLAIREIRHHLGRFLLTTVGVGLLLMLVMGMGGIYRGLVQEATLLIDRIDADFWVVQSGTRGPFAETSRLPASMEDRVLAVPGVASSRGFVSTTIQRAHQGTTLRLTVQGLAWPHDRGAWLPIVAGRPLQQAHYEVIVDESLPLKLGEQLTLARDTYTVVGLTRAMTSPSGDAMAFFTRRDAQVIQFDSSGEAIRLERSARYRRASEIDLGRTLPHIIERSRGQSSSIPALGPPAISAVLVTLAEGADPARVRAILDSWPDATTYSNQEQRQLLLGGVVDRARRQLGLFRVLLIVVSGIIMGLILYTLTLDKLHDIAMLKLIGARNSVILGLILQQALLLAGIGYVIAYAIGLWVFPSFPRRVVIVAEDLWMLAAVVVGIAVLASMMGIVKALRVEPHEVLS